MLRSRAYAVADPGFPLGGGAPTSFDEGAPMSDMGAFRQKCMQKKINKKELGPIGAGGLARPESATDMN